MAGFHDIIGHEKIKEHLQKAIGYQRVSHAYILSGEEGMGRKTIAKAFAMTLLCEKHGTEPCMECHSCKQFLSGNHPDVIWVTHEKPASIGVDDVRIQINDTVSIRPYSSPYKIYLVDEAEKMTVQAQNALLKTIEEPPEYVIFILATTEVHKIPITILSRCQHYDFKRISIETITDRMRDLMQTEQVEVEEKALRYIAKAADGSMRDALSLLDQCIAFYLGQKLTYDHVLEVLGAVDTDVFSRLLRKVLERDVAGVLDIVEDLVMQGRELTQLAADFTWYLRNLLLVKTSDNIEDVLDVSTENMLQLKEESKMIELALYPYILRTFRSAEVCDAEESASGSCTDQALYSGDGDWSGCTSGQNPCGRRQSRERTCCSCRYAAASCLREWR